MTLPLHCLDLVPDRIFSLNLEPLSLYFSSISALPLFFLIPCLPCLVLPYYHFPGTSCCLQVRFRYRFTCRPRITLFSDSKRQFSGRMVSPGDPARSNDEKPPNRQFPPAADFTHGAPRQPPLQDYAAYAHPSFRPQQRPF